MSGEEEEEASMDECACGHLRDEHWPDGSCAITEDWGDCPCSCFDGGVS
jgi:hypothetical protein